MSNKHDANVRKSALVNFQIGLIASLLFTFFMFEVYTTSQIIVVDPPIEDLYDDPIFTIGEFEIEKTSKKELAIKTTPQKVVDVSKADIVDDDTVIEDMSKVFKNEPVESTPFNPNILLDIPEGGDEPKSFPFKKVEAVPVFPGCEKLGTNEEKAACFSEKIGKIVSRRFNTDLGEKYGLSGIQRIYTQFDVDSNGMIKNIRVRAPHPKLEKEAERVINLFPEMTPGKQRGKPVTVKYSLPIVFKIQD
ncbi:energy transducer TonB [Aquimarina mytili]|uniref:Energy transducer TonB n=1 Tax=Aquimarina mytili TaxID=874423 RepID=A0A937A3F8_9FLAO|nr:energy transducer TonB [Aquimarina mytili]MBL0683674.1 energy transducer TonB [Aquimarina mytili]